MSSTKSLLFFNSVHRKLVFNKELKRFKNNFV